MAKLLKTLARKTLLSSEQNLVALDDVYETLRRLLSGRQVRGILDAGASDGRVTKKLLRCFPDAVAYAFEPNPAYRDAWLQLSSADKRCRITHAALADETGELDLNVTTSLGPTSLFRPNDRFTEKYPDISMVDHVEKVPVIKLDDWAAANGEPSIELMKFDIQAAELKALKGSTHQLQEHTLIVYTEIFFNHLYEGGAIFSDIDLYLRDYGFILYNMYKPRADDRGVLEQGNVIYIKPDHVTIDY